MEKKIKAGKSKKSLRDRKIGKRGLSGIKEETAISRLSEEGCGGIEAKFIDLLENIETAYFELDLKGNLIFFNEIVCRDLGYSREELKGMNFRSYSKPENIEIIKNIYKEIYQTGKPKTTVNFDVIRKEGLVITIEKSMSPMKNKSGEIIGFQGVSRDITQRINSERLRKEAEDALRRSEEKYRTILDTMEEGLYENDLKGNYTFVNNAACRQLECTPGELIGKNYREVTSSQMAPKLYEVYHRMFVTGKPEFLFTYDVPCSNGSARTFQMNATLIRNKAGEITGFRNLSRDVTELKKSEEEKTRLEQQLLQAKKMESIGRLAGGVAHDFNNMLTVILGYTELIKAMPSLDETLMRNMLEIEKAAKRSRDLTSQLLAFSRKQIIAPRLVDLNNLILDTQQTLTRLIGEDVDLRFYPGQDLWTIKFDSSQMEQILVNLAANARDAMPRGGKLTIETENIHLNEAYCKMHHGFLPGHYILLGISDDGAGIHKETLPHIFEPFFTTKDPGLGTGLGLATVYGIVKQNDGFINVYSEPGRGTTFKIYIPKCSEEGDIREETPETSAVAGTGTILLVEDDDMVRQITTEMLEAIGYTTIAMRNPLEAPGLFEKGDVNIDLVITDVVMPGMSGNDLRDRIEAINPGIKVLFMSGYTSNVIVHRGVLEAGVHFIQKPFNMSDLARKIREALNS